MSHGFAIPTWLYHGVHGPRMFDAAAKDFNLERLTADGWVDNPAKVAQRAPGVTNPAVTVAPTGEPVTTANGPEASSIAQADDAGAGAEAPQETPAMAEKDLLAIFHAEPTRLTKPELVELGKAQGVTVRKNWKEATLIKALQDHLNGDH